MRVQQLLAPMALLLVAAAEELVTDGVSSDCNDSSLSMPEEEPLVATGVSSVNFSSPILLTENVVTARSTAGASSSGESSSSIDFPLTTAPVVTESTRTEQPTMTTQALTEAPTTPPTEAPTAAPVVTSTAAPATTPSIETDSATNSHSDQSAQDARQSITTTGIPVATTAGSSVESTGASASSSDSVESGIGSHEDSESNSGDAPIAHPGSDSSTFQSVASAECSENEVDNVYTLYTNCRSAFDLCVSASDYQIFPYQGKHPTQTQIQGMAESDACIAMFVVVIEANFSACTIGGMPLVSAVETLLKISVDLAKGLKAEAPSADVFQELLTWRYEVDLAKAAGVPHDGSSELYAEFEANLDAALGNTTIRVNDNLSVDVRLSNGSYETFEDAIDFIIRDASAADMTPGYVRASSAVGSSSSSSSSVAKGIVIESSSSAAPSGCTPSLWSLVVAVVASVLLVRRV